MALYSEYFYSSEFNSVFSDERMITQMLRFEAALARAQAELGIIPVDAADLITEACRVELINSDELRSGVKQGGNAALPLVKQVTRIVGSMDQTLSGYVHFGATSQDVLDTAMILLIRDAITWYVEKIDLLKRFLIKLTQTHRFTFMVGRTLLQQAKPITVGLKTASWLDGMLRCEQRIAWMKNRLLRIQLGGAVGTRSQVTNRAVVDRMAELLDLQSSLPWHTQRDTLAEWASSLAILCGCLAKTARDVSLLMQPEIGEVHEGSVEGRGTSSAMPHKRNPVLCAAILANAQRAPHLAATILATLPQEHERSLGLWHTEWEVIAKLHELAAGSLERSIELIEGLEVDVERMKMNLDASRGLIYSENISLALAPKMGKAEAIETVSSACRQTVQEKKHLRDVLVSMHVELSNSELDTLFDPAFSTEMVQEIIDSIVSNSSLDEDTR